MSGVRTPALNSASLPAVALNGVELALIALAALALARFGWALITPAGPVGPLPVPAAAAPLNPDAFAAFDPFFRTQSSGPSAVSSLELTLVGTRVDQASGRGSAIIILPDDTQSSIAVGEEILPGVRLAAVQFDSITLDNNGTREELYLDQSTASTTTPITPPTPTPSTQPRLAADLQANPRMDGTRITGLILTPKGTGTAFSAAGLQYGDVLLSVDGTPVAALGDPAALTRRMDSGGLTLEIERAGRTQTVRIPAGGGAQ